MPWVENKGAMKRYEVKKDEKGRPYFEVDDAAEAQHRKLHPATGTEADEQWPVTEPEPEAPPLLDLDLAWCEIIAGTPITVAENEAEVGGDTVEVRNANLMGRELRYHILASTAGVPRKSKEETDRKPDESGSADTSGKDADIAEDETRATDDEADAETEDGDDVVKSVYGASILLKLQWEDRSVQKNVPKRTYAELGLFVSDITLQLGMVIEKNPSAAQCVLDVIALELTPLLLARYLDGIETCTSVLEDCCYALLKLCTARANPKEMHMAIKTFTSKIDSVYMEATSYLVLQPVLILWGEIIIRMPQKRRLFLGDFVKVLDRMLPCAEAFETSFVPDDGGVGVEHPGRISRIPDVLLQFFENLTKVQVKQRETDDAIKLQVDMLGREKLSPSLKESEAPPDTGKDDGKKEGGNGTEETVGNTEEKQVKNASKIKDVTIDWVNERAMTLAKVLQLQAMIWSRLPAPPGEERDVPKKKVKSQKRDRAAKKGKMSDEQKEEALDRCAALFNNLGWTNPVVVCQLAANGLNLDHASRDGELMKTHIGSDVRSKKERKNTLYSVSAVGQYICSSLRLWTRSCRESSADEDTRKGPYYEVDLSGSAFDLLDPCYALDLVMPYLTSVIMQAGITVSIAGVVTLRAFLDRISDKRIETFDEILRLRSGTASFGRDVNIFGLVHHLGKALAGYDDPKHRRIGYETLQAMLRKCASPVARYVLVDCVYYEASRHAIAAQLMTELKDAVRYSDITWREGVCDIEEIAQASQLRSRLADDCLARYFTPRKELLAYMNPISTAASLLMFLTQSDKQLLAKVTDEEVKKATEKRMRFCKAYGRLGKELIRAIASVAEHDRKNIPVSQLAKQNTVDAVALFQASGRTLNQCVGSLSLLDSGMEGL